MNINEFVKQLENISPEKRELPLIIITPNGEEAPPNIKMKFTDYGNPPAVTVVEAMVITWQD